MRGQTGGRVLLLRVAGIGARPRDGAGPFSSQPNAACRLTEARAGIPFPFGPMTVVRAELAPEVARRTVLLAKNCGPEEALRLGFLDELEPPERILPRALEVARDLASFPGDAYGRIKRQLRAEPLARIREMVTRETFTGGSFWLRVAVIRRDRTCKVRAVPRRTTLEIVTATG